MEASIGKESLVKSIDLIPLATLAEGYYWQVEDQTENLLKIPLEI